MHSPAVMKHFEMQKKFIRLFNSNTVIDGKIRLDYSVKT